MNDKKINKFIKMQDKFFFTLDVNSEKLIDDLINLFLTKVKKYDHMYLPEKYDAPNDTPLRIAKYLAHYVIKIFIENSKEEQENDTNNSSIG